MGQRRGAARREQRHAKRALARAERGVQKYANQKGGARPAKGKGSGSSARRRKALQQQLQQQTADDDDEMVVVSGGEAKRLGAPPNSSEAAPARFTDTEKKVRALSKKLRQLDELRQRARRGLVLDEQQRAKLRQRAKVVQELDQLSELTGATEQNAIESDSGSEELAEPTDQPPAPAVAAPTQAAAVPAATVGPGGKLAERRQEKQRRLEARAQRKRVRQEERDAQLLARRMAGRSAGSGR